MAVAMIDVRPWYHQKMCMPSLPARAANESKAALYTETVLTCFRLDIAILAWEEWLARFRFNSHHLVNLSQSRKFSKACGLVLRALVSAVSNSV